MNKVTLQGEIEVVYVMGGISSKNNRPYLQVSDGIEAKFLNLSKDIDPTVFAKYDRTDPITLLVETNPLTGSTKVLEVVS